MGKQQSTSLRLSPEANQLKRKLAKKLGLSQAAIVEMGIRVLASGYDIHYEEPEAQGDKLQTAYRIQYLTDDVVTEDSGWQPGPPAVREGVNMMLTCKPEARGESVDN